MSTVTEWVTEEERATVEAAIQEQVRANGHEPLSSEAVDTIIVHAGRMAVAFRGTVTSKALAIARALWPPPERDWKDVADKLKALAAAKDARWLKASAYRPEPPHLRRERR